MYHLELYFYGAKEGIKKDKVSSLIYEVNTMVPVIFRLDADMLVHYFMWITGAKLPVF